ncbi:MAG TPA: hypothetical protein VMW11_03955 [Candidatus Dormibacteraeota bacterium]|nr:hypothetical protein [Candidatus Dormibacteraeota bacterium]
MKDLQREIVSQVASGEISAEEGAARLEALQSSPAAATAPAPAPRPADSATRLVKVISQFGNAEIVGDPSVAFAVAEGPHRARQDGATMVIEHVPFDEDDNFSFGRGDRRISVVGWQQRKLRIRMNPGLALLTEVQAGNVRVEGVHGPITGEVQAGNFRVADFRDVINLMVQAGNVSATGRLVSGSSKVRCEMGAVKVNLEKGSSVRITTRTTMGKVAIDSPNPDRISTGPSGKDVVVGSGDATLDIECTMGNVKVSVD